MTLTREQRALWEKAAEGRIEDGVDWPRIAMDILRALDTVETERDEAVAKVARVQRAIGMYGFRFSSREDHAEAVAIVRAALDTPATEEER